MNAFRGLQCHASLSESGQTLHVHRETAFKEEVYFSFAIKYTYCQSHFLDLWEGLTGLHAFQALHFRSTSL